jgi:hypothetical protein
MTTDESPGRELIAAGRERVKHFSWEKRAQQTLKVLETVESFRRLPPFPTSGLTLSLEGVRNARQISSNYNTSFDGQVPAR